MTDRSALYQLIEERLEGTLAEYVAARRAKTSWRSMAADLTERAGVRINHETLRMWFADRIQITVADEPLEPAATEPSERVA